jgi:hypothetical protein
MFLDGARSPTTHSTGARNSSFIVHLYKSLCYLHALYNLHPLSPLRPSSLGTYQTDVKLPHCPLKTLHAEVNDAESLLYRFCLMLIRNIPIHVIPLIYLRLPLRALNIKV